MDGIVEEGTPSGAPWSGGRDCMQFLVESCQMEGGWFLDLGIRLGSGFVLGTRTGCAVRTD